MRYCPTCDAEYREARILCADDGTPLLGRQAWAAALELQGRTPRPLLRLATVTVLESLFAAEELAHRLRDEGVESTVASTKPAILGSLTSPVHEAFAIVVPETEKERAFVFVTAWRADLEATTDEASKAAEDEERAHEPR
ncbi:MAG: hypothetical protein RL199_1892 [Pseudomonadota bacterium]|jgi:hypothetical protein